jgi:hypothetical protein
MVINGASSGFPEKVCQTASFSSWWKNWLPSTNKLREGAKEALAAPASAIQKLLQNIFRESFDPGVIYVEGSLCLLR